jgi:DNA-binding NarL/FixJ family response regulator
LKQSGKKAAARPLLLGRFMADIMPLERLDDDPFDARAAPAALLERATKRALTPREKEVLALVARGWSNKAIAMELGLGISTVSVYLTHAAAKLGVRSRVAMIRALADQRADLALPSTLSATERCVVSEVLGGKSNAEIAQARGTSTRTVANQIANAFRKLGVRSRGELAAQLLFRGVRR